MTHIFSIFSGIILGTRLSNYCSITVYIELFYFALQYEIKMLSERIANGEKIDIDRYEALKRDLSEFEIEKCRGVFLRSKASWANETDKCTKYFLEFENN